MAKLIKADGTEQELTVGKGGLNMTQIQEAVGGFFQTVKAKEPGMVILCDEDAKMKNKPINSIATAKYMYGDNDVVVGDVIYCKATEIS